MNRSRTLLDWHAEHARELDAMRANTARWVRRGIIKTPVQVKVHAAKVMSVKPGAKRKVKVG